MRGRLLVVVCVAVMGAGCWDGTLPTGPTPEPPARLEAIDPACFLEVISPELSMWVCK